MTFPEYHVYVAGPYSPTRAQRFARSPVTGELTKEQHRECVEENILIAKKLGVEVAKLGVTPIIPHANTDYPELEDVQPYEFWIRATAEQLRRCNAVIFAEEWEESKGSRGEHDVAVSDDIPRFFSVDELQQHISRSMCR